MRQFSFAILASLGLAFEAGAQQLIGFETSSFGDVVLSRTQSSTGFQLEPTVGDYNNEFISRYSADSVFAMLGRPVGRLDIFTDAGNFPCTAFLVASDLILTNHHCVPGITSNASAGAQEIIGLQFVAGYTQDGVAEGAETFLVRPQPIEASQELDYAVLRVVGAPGERFGVLPLGTRAPRNNDPFWVIGHPMGEAQRISREQCRANTPVLSQGKLLHTCDTLPGNSGSPVLDATTQKVIGLHHAGSSAGSVNFAIPMATILEQSAVLAGLSAVGVGSDVGSEVDSGAGDNTRELDAYRALTAALSATDPSQELRLLRGVVQQFPDTDAAKSARAALQSSDVVPETPSLQETEVPEMSARGAVSLVMDWLDLWQKVTPRTVTQMSEFYGERLWYFGTDISILEALNIKSEFVARWPNRRMTFIPDHQRSKCNGRDFCVVHGTYEWAFSNPARRTQSNGRASLRVGLRLDGENWVISQEGGEVIPAN